MATSTPTPEDPSYTKMDSADLEEIGAHCQFPYCHQLDFLPFRCESCKSTFCVDHRTETAHKCSHAGEWAKNRRKNSVGRPTAAGLSGPTLPGLTPTQCSEAHCKTVINTIHNTGSRCDDCNRQYCLKHRFREEHDCKNLSPAAGQQQKQQQQQSHLDAQAEKLRLGFSKLRSWGKSRQESLKPKPKPNTNSRAGQLAALNTLKRDAKGDPTLPADKRLYLHVEAEAATTSSKLPRASLYFSRDWSVGRMLDEAARRLQVANVNNRVETEEQRLRVYHVEAGRLLEFSEKLGGGDANGNSDTDKTKPGLRSGDTVVLLRGVGPAVPDLIEP